ncbi:MAG: sugar phosphate nucleotidyltransferase [Actinomycetota bacterium]|nr:sugar phosphate nucleotidyltransferase [Actinomycetota bacterium]
MDDIRGVLFAAGRGKRLRPLTDTIPKPALPVAGTPLAAWALLTMLHAVPRVVVNVSHLGEVVESALAPYAPPGSLEFFREPPEPYGTAGTLRELRDRIRGPVLTYNSDAISDLDARGMMEFHRRGAAAATVSGIETDDAADLQLQGDRAVRLIDRRTASAPGVLFSGMAVLEAEALNAIPSGPQGLTEAVFSPLIEAGELAVYVHDGYFMDVGTPERYDQAIKDVRAGRAPAPPQASS